MDVLDAVRALVDRWDICLTSAFLAGIFALGRWRGQLGTLALPIAAGLLARKVLLFITEALAIPIEWPTPPFAPWLSLVTIVLGLGVLALLSEMIEPVGSAIRSPGTNVGDPAPMSAQERQEVLKKVRDVEGQSSPGSGIIRELDAFLAGDSMGRATLAPRLLELLKRLVRHPKIAEFLLLGQPPSVLIELLCAPDRVLRACALNLLAKLSPDEIRESEIIELALQESRCRIRAARHSACARTLLLWLANDPVEEVRKEALHHILPVSAVELDSLLRSVYPDVRIFAIEQFADTKSGVSRAWLLRLASQDDQEKVRATAQNKLHDLQRKELLLLLNSIWSDSRAFAAAQPRITRAQLLNLARSDSEKNVRKAALARLLDPVDSEGKLLSKAELRQLLLHLACSDVENEICKIARERLHNPTRDELDAMSKSRCADIRKFAATQDNLSHERMLALACDDDDENVRSEARRLIPLPNELKLLIDSPWSDTRFWVVEKHLDPKHSQSQLCQLASNDDDEDVRSVARNKVCAPDAAALQAFVTSPHADARTFAAEQHKATPHQLLYLACRAADEKTRKIARDRLQNPTRHDLEEMSRSRFADVRAFAAAHTKLPHRLRVTLAWRDDNEDVRAAARTKFKCEKLTKAELTRLSESEWEDTRLYAATQPELPLPQRVRLAAKDKDPGVSSESLKQLTQLPDITDAQLKLLLNSRWPDARRFAAGHSALSRASLLKLCGDPEVEVARSAFARLTTEITGNELGSLRVCSSIWQEVAKHPRTPAYRVAELLSDHLPLGPCNDEDLKAAITLGWDIIDAVPERSDSVLSILAARHPAVYGLLKRLPQSRP